MTSPTHQPTLPPFPCDHYKYPEDGRQSSGHVVWPVNGMEVFLPMDSDRAATVAWMLKEGRDATAPDALNGCLIKVLKAPEPGCSFEESCRHDEAMTEALSSGRLVALTGYKDGDAKYEWSPKCLAATACTTVDYSRVEWQSFSTSNSHEEQPGAPERDGGMQRNGARPGVGDLDAEDIIETVKGTIQDFYNASMDPEDVVNCLDIPLPSDTIPQIIRRISSSTRAMYTTAKLGFKYSEERPRHISVSNRAGSGGKKRKNVDRNVVKDMEEYEDPESDDENFERFWEGVKRTLKQSNDSFGMRTILADINRLMAWALYATGGAFSKAHNDGGGVCTYVICREGLKVWSLLEPQTQTQQAQNGDSDKIRSAMNVRQAILSCVNDYEALKELVVPYNIILGPGTILIQPPDAIHQVYTLVKSIFTGGHFLLLEAMHLTEVTRIGAARTKQAATNASHPGILRLLSRIVLALIYEPGRSVLRKPFISLARMVLWPKYYEASDVDDEQRKVPNLPRDHDSEGDLSAAQSVTRLILRHNNIRIDAIRPKDFSDGNWLADDQDLPWKEPGTATIVVPELRQLFRVFSKYESDDEKEAESRDRVVHDTRKKQRTAA